MPDYVKHNAQGLIIRKWRSVDPSIVENESNIVLVDRATYNAITKYWIVDTGIVREMNQSEKDQLNAYEAEQEAIAEEERLQRYEVSNLELLTALVKCINKRIPSNPILKQEVIDEIKNARN